MFRQPPPSRLAPLLRTLTVAVIGAALAACTSQPVDTSGPPPEGYASWDDYFAAQDQLQMDVEATRRADAMDRSVPGISVNR